MKKTFAIILILIGTSSSYGAFSQNFLSLKQASLIHSDSVQYIKITRQKLTHIPEVLYNYKNLIALDLSKNKIKNISDSISVFDQLEMINLRKNKFEVFPESLFQLKTIKEIIISSNQIGFIPEEISQCTQLRKLDLYNNPISDLGQGLQELKNMEELDLRGLMMNAKKQKAISEKLPLVHILFDAPCNCVD